MEKCESSSHVRWECRYHVVFITKYRRNMMHGQTKPRPSLTQTPRFAGQAKATAYGRGRLLVDPKFAAHKRKLEKSTLPSGSKSPVVSVTYVSRRTSPR